VGCPANGISKLGVKIRTRASARSLGSTNVVSDRFIWRASACIRASLRPRASVNTQSAFPDSLWRSTVKTLTSTKGSVITRI
jgi:hypothetical protein